MKKASSVQLFSIIGVVLVLLSILSGCNSSGQKNEKSEEHSDNEATKEVAILELSDYPLPTSFEVTKIIHEAGAPYYLSLTNEADNVDNYISQKEKALNLGVYGTDLCYATTYLMKQETMLYLECSKKLIDDLGISNEFNSGYLQRVENNLNDRDSLILIVSDSFYGTWKYLTTNEDDIYALLIVCGSWIEGMYITANVALTSKDNTVFMEALADQKGSLKTLIELIQPVIDDEIIVDISVGFSNLLKIYEGIEESVNKEQLESISDLIESIREGII